MNPKTSMPVIIRTIISSVLLVAAPFSTSAGQPIPISGRITNSIVVSGSGSSALVTGGGYVVPAGKILMLDAISMKLNPTILSPGRIKLGPAEMFIPPGLGTLTFPRPIKMSAGQELRPLVAGDAGMPGESFSAASGDNLTQNPNPIVLPINAAGSYLGGPLNPTQFDTNLIASFFGTLIDAGDLYVSIPSEFKSIQVQPNSVLANVGFASRAPASVRIEKSKDLKTWSTETNAVIPLKLNTTNMLVTIPRGSETNAFYRTRVIPR